ncbi:putative HTH-type transcriptional regulator [Paenibacillus allorhizoplanae]|uniref:HTH-type transcriptional regulator n=1 Tax=Paenibacillus allorhizoplanae TaxID=2905648 RepID=A0ABM9CZL2_9BACL|nr:MerR family transcriptional regulator [Paenibacillus allorhizoplanae]CAH1233035.1 putative HTH-type transcriptional regulator [Paenibacillus allorhizoplanae]
MGSAAAFSIKEISKMTGLTEDALRYYEKIELLPRAKRRENGRRVYNKEDMQLMKLIICLKKMGVSLKDIKEFASLSYKEDILSAPEVYDKVQSYRRKLQDQIDHLQKILGVLDYKIANKKSLLKDS